MRKEQKRASRPLKPAVFHILLALSGGRRHGLGISDEVEELTGGAIRLGPGTLYRSLKLMTEADLVRPIPSPGEESDPRRKFYQITGGGRKRLEEEAERFARIVQEARRKKVLRGSVS